MTKSKLEKPDAKKVRMKKTQPGVPVDPNWGGARSGAGRPEFVPTDAERRQVEALSGYGLPMEQIAVLVRGGIHMETLREHFADELVAGKAKANSGVGKTLYQKAMSGDTAAMIWWSKTQMKWSERIEHVGANGGPIKQEHTVTVDPSEAYMRLLRGES